MESLAAAAADLNRRRGLLTSRWKQRRETRPVSLQRRETRPVSRALPTAAAVRAGTTCVQVPTVSSDSDARDRQYHGVNVTANRIFTKSLNPKP